MPRYAPQMPQADLRQMIIDKAIRNNYLEDYGDIDLGKPDMDRIVYMLLEENLPEVEKDWSKIDFSTENMDVAGEKMTPDGIPYLLIETGGDWETELVAIIYFDGKKLRGYVPKDGNSYNHKEKSAFGNNDSDAAEGAKQFGKKFIDDDGCFEVDPNMALIEQDISKRIQAKGTYSYVPGTKVVSKAKDKAAEQAAIEKDQDLTGPITSDMVYAVISLAAGASYVMFELRSSRRALTIDEGNRLVGVPSRLEKTEMESSKQILWYSPMNCYPMETLKILEASGFVKAPDNDLTPWQGAKTIYI